MSKDQPPSKSLTLITLTSARQLRMTVVPKDGSAILDVNASLSRIEAQLIADALLEYAGARPKAFSRGHVTTFAGTYDPDYKASRVIHLTDAPRGRRGK